MGTGKERNGAIAVGRGKETEEGERGYENQIKRNESWEKKNNSNGKYDTKQKERSIQGRTEEKEGNGKEGGGEKK